MLKYTIYFKPSAEKELNKLDSVIADKIEAKIDLLEFDPYPVSSKKLKGESSFRIRVGDYRIVYEIDDINKTVIIFKVRHRKDVYRK